jgi:hypothetical protein
LRAAGEVDTVAVLEGARREENNSRDQVAYTLQK